MEPPVSPSAVAYTVPVAGAMAWTEKVPVEVATPLPAGLPVQVALVKILTVQVA
jgi:hypothetical protein